VIDDEDGHTLVAKSVKGTNKKAAQTLGGEIARVCKANHITRVVFDRGGYRYHGAVKEIADAARKGGLVF